MNRRTSPRYLSRVRGPSLRHTINLWIMVAVIALPAFAREDYTRNVDKTLPVAAGQRVRMVHKFGDVSIRTQAKAELSVHAVIRTSASNADEAKRFGEGIRVEVHASGAGVLIETVYPKEEDFGGWFRNFSYTVSYEITMPETSPIEVNNSFSAVSIRGLKANGEIVTSHGRLEFRDGSGTQRLENSFAPVLVARNAGDLTLTNTNGAVEVSDVSGTVRIKDRFGKVTLMRSGGGTVVNGNGEVELSQIGGDLRVTTSFAGVEARDVKGSLTVMNQNGIISAVNVKGAADLTTSFARVRFDDIGGQLTVKAQNTKVEGGKVGGGANIQTSFAGIDVTDIHKGVKVVSQNGGVTLAGVGEGAAVKTSFGPIVLSDVGGQVDAENQNGSVEVSVNPAAACKPISVRTSFAHIRMRLPGTASYDLTARTTFAKVHSDFPMMVSGALSGDSVSGKIGGGACPMSLVDQNGQIEILRR